MSYDPKIPSLPIVMHMLTQVNCQMNITNSLSKKKNVFLILKKGKTLAEVGDELLTLNENPLSEYEQERLQRINENNKTLLKLVWKPFSILIGYANINSFYIGAYIRIK